MNGTRHLPPAHTRSPMWVMLKLFIYNLLWLAEYQCKGMVKFNSSDLFSWGQFQRWWKRLNWKNLLLQPQLWSPDKLIWLDVLHNSNVLNFQYTYLISYLHSSLRSKLSAEMNNIHKAWRTERSSVVKPRG